MIANIKNISSSYDSSFWFFSSKNQRAADLAVERSTLKIHTNSDTN